MGHEAAVSTLLRNGAEIDHCNQRGETALMIAGKRGCEAVVERLLDAGANTKVLLT